MIQNYINKKIVSTAVRCALAITLLSSFTLAMPYGQDFDGQEMLAVARVALGGEEYAGLQFITAKSTGFVNVAPIMGAGLGTGGAASTVEVKFAMTDYQDKNSRRRLNVKPTGPSIGETYLVYSGNSGGGMYMGNEFRVSDATAARHWGLMGFATLNMAIERQVKTDRIKDSGNNYVVKVRFNDSDELHYYLDKRTFLISKVVSYYNGKLMVEEERSDYRRASCLMLPFRVVTKLSGQRVSDLTIEGYDLKTVVPEATFNIVGE
jgi:hypothetical protein